MGWQRTASGGPPLVVMVEPTDFGDLDNLARFGWLHSPRPRAVHVQREVCPPVVVVAEVAAEDPPKVFLAEDDDVVQAVASDATDDPLYERVSAVN